MAPVHMASVSTLNDADSLTKCSRLTMYVSTKVERLFAGAGRALKRWQPPHANSGNKAPNCVPKNLIFALICPALNLFHLGQLASTIGLPGMKIYPHYYTTCVI